MIYTEYNAQGKGNPLGPVGGIIFLLLILVGLYFIAKGIFSLLYWAAPVLILATLVIDYKTILGYFQFIGRMLKSNTVVGILMILLTVFAYPIVSGFLFAKAVTKRYIKKKIAEKEQVKYAEYEDVTETEDAEFLELPDPPEYEKQQDRAKNEYDDMF